MRHEIAEMVTEVAKVVDFGISKIRRTGGQMTRDMTLLGTPQFMSPEAALGQNSALDGRADQWSLAVIMYLCLTGRLPFDSENPVGVLYMVVHEKPVPIKQLAPDLPDHIVAAIEKAMSKRKDDRFPRMVDFVKAVLGQTQAAPSRLNLAPAKATDAQPAQAVERPRVQPSPQPARPLPAALPSVGHMPTGPGAVPAKPGPIGGTPTPQFDPPTVPQTTPSLLPAPTKLAPVRTPSAPSGNTPTNIVLNDAEMQALLSRSATTPVSNDAAAADFEQVPTRLVGNNDPTPPVPEPGLKAPSLDKPFDPYPSTLSRATGQQSISTGGALVDGSEVTGKNPPVGLLLSTIGVNPRSNLRLGLSGAAIVVCIAILIWLLSGGDSKEQVASGPPAITDTKTASESPDAGISDDKTGGKSSGPTGRAPGGSSPSGSPSKRPTAKPTDTGSKRIKIDPGV